MLIVSDDVSQVDQSNKTAVIIIKSKAKGVEEPAA